MKVRGSTLGIRLAVVSILAWLMLLAPAAYGGFNPPVGGAAPPVGVAATPPMAVPSKATGTGAGSSVPLGAAGSGWIPDQRVDFQANGPSRNATVATGPGGLLHAAWEQDIGGNHWRIFYASSRDSGVTWSSPVQLPGITDQTSPEIAVSPVDGVIYIAHENVTALGSREIHVASSSNGVTWTDGLASPAAPQGIAYRNPSVITEHDVGLAYHIYVAFEASNSTSALMQLYRSVAGPPKYGPVFSQACGNPSSCSDPALAYQRGPDTVDRVFISYLEIFKIPVRNVSLIWLENNAFKGRVVIGTQDRIGSPTIAAARNGQTVLVAWASRDPSVGRTRVVFSENPNPNDPSRNWTVPVGISNATLNATGPRLAVDGEGTTSTSISGNYHLVWSVSDPPFDVRYSRRATSPKSLWATEQSISDIVSRASSAFPSKGLTTQSRSGAWYPGAVWTDLRDPKGSHIFYVTPGNRVGIYTQPVDFRVAVDGNEIPTPALLTWAQGTQHILDAPSPQFNPSGQQYLWKAWSDGLPQRHLVTASPNNTSYTATFRLPGPTVTITYPLDGAVITERSLSVRGTSQEAERVEVRLAAGPWLATIGPSPWSAVLSLAGLSNGAYVIEARGLNGLVESPHAQVKIQLTIPLAPTVTILSPHDEDTIGNASLAVSGSSTNADLVEVRIGGGPWTTASGVASWRVTLAVDQLTNGDWVIEARATRGGSVASDQVTVHLSLVRFSTDCTLGPINFPCWVLPALVPPLLGWDLARKARRKEEPKGEGPSEGSITYWNRLEPRPRMSLQDPEGLAARVRDPAWFLARQWQMGEFQGADTGSPAHVELNGNVARLTGWRVPWEGTTRPLEASAPLEAQVESEPLGADWSTRVELGQTFEDLLRQAGHADLITDIRSAYPLAPPLGDGPGGQPDAATARFLSVCAGRSLDGFELYRQAMASRPGLPPALDVVPGSGSLGGVLAEYLAWVHEVFGGLTDHEEVAVPPGWQPQRLGYDVEVLTGGSDILSAHPDHDGGLGWSAFDLQHSDGIPAQSRGEGLHLAIIPTHVRFRGMPNARWWDFEDATLDYGAITPGTQDLAKLIFMDFMLIHSNDWFVIPVPLPVGSLCRVDSFLVHDVFGGTTLVERADAAPAGGGRWTMFSTALEGDPSRLADFFILPPSAGSAAQVGRTLEEVRFLRDEAANMAWAVEHTTENGLGEPWSGHERSLSHATPAPEPSAPSSLPEEVPRPPLRYQIQTEVPENWIPFLPITLDPLSGAIALQRGRLLSVSPGEISTRGPAGRILGGPSPLVVRDEEVPRTGLRILRSTYRSRWIDGSTHLWVARRRAPGEGEGSSGLRFDQALRT